MDFRKDIENRVNSKVKASQEARAELENEARKRGYLPMSRRDIVVYLQEVIPDNDPAKDEELKEIKIRLFRGISGIETSSSAITEKVHQVEDLYSSAYLTPDHEQLAELIYWVMN